NINNMHNIDLIEINPNTAESIVRIWTLPFKIFSRLTFLNSVGEVRLNTTIRWADRFGLFSILIELLNESQNQTRIVSIVGVAAVRSDRGGETALAGRCGRLTRTDGRALCNIPIFYRYKLRFSSDIITLSFIIFGINYVQSRLPKFIFDVPFTFEIILVIKHYAGCTWDMFKNLVRDKYYPSYYRAEMERQFLALQQGTRTIDEYEREFTRLAGFAPDLVRTEAQRAQRFIDGLYPAVRHNI
ncbi:Unknown protein, partial [Striga hermonthica]